MKIQTYKELDDLPVGTDLFIVPEIQFNVTPFNYWTSISANIMKLHPVQKVRKIETAVDYPEFINHYVDNLKRAQYTEPDDIAEHFVDVNYGEESIVDDPVVMFLDESDALKYFYTNFQKARETLIRLTTTIDRLSNDMENSPFIVDHKDKYPEKWI